MFCGIDIGSLSTKVVILSKNREMLGYLVATTGIDGEATAELLLKELLDKLTKSSKNHKNPEELLSATVSTGYGRSNIKFANRRVTEISCHGKGAFFFNPKVRTIIDIGGQDSKVIKLNSQGRVVDFVMNDKCAAGTGRFLEVMSQALDCPLNKMPELSARATQDLTISSMCTVFAESEVISLLAKKTPIEEIIRGINLSVADRTCGMVGRVGQEEQLMMSGGVAKNQGVRQALEEKLNTGLTVAFDPQIVGAVGAALYALEEVV